MMDQKRREEIAYNQEDHREMRDKDDNKRMYKETLDNQVKMNFLNRNNYGKMTYQEKKINRTDLHSYKKHDLNTVHALIPGIKNIESIGTKPLQRGALRMMELSPGGEARG